MGKTMWRLSDKYEQAGFTLIEDCGFVELHFKEKVVGSWLAVASVMGSSFYRQVTIQEIEKRADQVLNELQSGISFGA